MSQDQQHSDNEDIMDLLDDLGSLSQCPLCHTSYEEHDLVIIDELDNVSLVHCTCANCQNAVLAMLIAAEFGVSSVGVLTDLSEKDVRRIVQSEPISQDDILTFHTLLQNKQKSIFHYVHKQ